MAWQNSLWLTYKAATSNQLFISKTENLDKWENIQEIGQQTSNSPSVTAFKSRLLMVYKAETSDQIFVTQSDNGTSWEKTTQINQQTTDSPSVAILGDKVYMVYKAATSNQIFISSSSDGINWFDTHQIGQQTTSSPSLCNFNNMLYLVYKAETSNEIYISTSVDGKSWSNTHQIGQQTTSIVALTCFKDELYIAYKAATSNKIFKSHSKDSGSTWCTEELNIETDTAPCLAEYNGRLIMAYKSSSSTNIFTDVISGYNSWMADNAVFIQDKKLADIALPGTHDSGTYGIDKNSADAPDAPEFVSIVKSWTGIDGIVALTTLLSPIIGPAAAAIAAISIYEYVKINFDAIIAGWAKAQGNNIFDQLNLGVRYLDLRVAPKGSQLHIVHSKYSVPVSDIVSQVNQFINDNDKEIVILDFNHFYGMKLVDHYNLIENLSTTFGSKLALCSMTTNAKIQNFWNDKKQVIVLYDNKGDVIKKPEDSNLECVWNKIMDILKNDFLWPNSSIDSHWPNKTDVESLITDLNSGLPNNHNQFFVRQGILTPDTTLILKGLIPKSNNPSNLKELATVTASGLVDWIPKKKNDRLNIVIADWVQDTPKLIDEILALNS